ncbi:MAG TPA: lactate utilization protein [Pyrinomonadaceae bacterium]|nr:lactate utilization protein [Pyrinomonadaceae bacterium]
MSKANPTVNQNGVLDNVRRALGRSSTVPPIPLDPFIEPSAKTDIGELVERFTEEATAVRARVYYMSDKLQLVAGDGEQSGTERIDKLKLVGQVGARVAEICRSVGATEVALSDSALIAEMNLQEQLGTQGFSIFIPDAVSSAHEQTAARLAKCDVGLTAADYAIAETGTIVLSSDEPNALLVSLLPAVHIALVRSSQIAASLDEVISKIGKERIGRLDSSPSVTLITGPSRTSDVELVLSIGVHGPKELHVIVIDWWHS